MVPCWYDALGGECLLGVGNGRILGVGGNSTCYIVYCGKWGLDHIGYGAMPWSLVSGGEIYFDDRVRIRNAVMACLPTGKKELMCFSSLSIDIIRVPDFHALVVKLFS